MTGCIRPTVRIPTHGYESHNSWQTFYISNRGTKVDINLSVNDQGSISSTFYVRIFHTNSRFGSFFYVHVTRENDVPTKKSYVER